MAIFVSYKDRLPDNKDTRRSHLEVIDYTKITDKDAEAYREEIDSGKSMKIQSQAYQVIMLPDSYEKRIKQQIQPVYDRKGVMIKKSRAYLDEAEAKKFGFDSTAQDKRVRHKVIDMIREPEKLIAAERDTSKDRQLPSISIDRMAETAGSFTIAPAGADYASGVAFAGDIGSPQTDNLTGQYIDTVIENAAITFTQQVDTYFCKLTANWNPYGNPNNQITINQNHNNDSIIAFDGANNAGGEFIIEKLYISGAMMSSNANIINFVSTGGIEGNFYIRNVMMAGYDANGNTLRLFSPNNTNMIVLIYNFMSWGNVGLDHALLLNKQNNSSVIENVTCSDGDIDFDSDVQSAYNCYATGYLNTGSLSNFAKCASEDASGNAGYQNLTAANEFVSTTAADGSDFLMPSKNGNLYFAGDAPAITGHNRSINNVAVEEGAISIGAKEQLVSGNKSRKIYKMNSHRMKYLWNRKNLIR